MTQASPWNPDQYARFQAQRSKPFHDLAGFVAARPGMKVVDLGCGTGELTATLHAHLGAAQTTGVDSSETMLARAPSFAAAGLRFARHDIRAFCAASDDRFDLVFSNAALQWLPDHDTLWTQVAQLVGPGGQLAVQIPANDDHPSHVCAQRVARQEPFATALGGWARHFPVEKPEWYSAKLFALGFDEPRVELRVYPHVMPSPASVVEWTKGSLLTAYQRRMSPDLFAEYLQRYTDVLLRELGEGEPYLYPFKRILMWGRRGPG